MGLTQLSGLDASFLYLETGRSFGHVSSILVLDRPDDSSYVPYDEYRARMARAVVDYLPLRRRLVEVPFGLDHPYWAEDPDFDLDFHIRHIAVPPPGEPAELDQLIARLIGRPLDRNKPLWEAYVIEGLKNDRFAIFTKMHHSTIDGAAGAMLTQQMFAAGAGIDLDAEIPPLPKADPLPRPADVLNKAMFDLARRPGSLRAGEMPHPVAAPVVGALVLATTDAGTCNLLLPKFTLLSMVPIQRGRNPSIRIRYGASTAWQRLKSCRAPSMKMVLSICST